MRKSRIFNLLTAVRTTSTTNIMTYRIILQNMLYILVSSVIVSTVAGLCPQNPNCDCTANHIICRCSDNDDITLSNSEVQFTGKQITIQGCGKVLVEKLSMNSVLLDSLYFTDLVELKIQPYSFSEATIKDLIIRNISILNIESYGFSQIKDSTNLVITDFIAENFLPVSFAGMEVQNIEIKNSHIGTIHARAFDLSDMDTFTMENISIGAFDINSLHISRGKRFNFLQNSVMHTAFSSIFISEFDEMDVGFCDFRQIHSNMLIVKEVEHFSLHDCDIEAAEKSALWAIDVTDKVSFFNNQITEAEEDSLIPNFGPNVLSADMLYIKGNSFTCDCNLDWLWMDTTGRYKPILDTSVCHRPENLIGEKLSRLVLSLDNIGVCTSVILSKNSTETITHTPLSTIINIEKWLSRNTTKEPKTTDQIVHYSTTDGTSEPSKFVTGQSKFNRSVTAKVAESKKYEGKQNDGVGLILCNKLLIIMIVIFKYQSDNYNFI